jgi:hypothetical protein
MIQSCKEQQLISHFQNGALKCAGAEARFFGGFDGTTESRALLPAAAKACDARNPNR